MGRPRKAWIGKELKKFKDLANKVLELEDEYANLTDKELKEIYDEVMASKKQ